MYRKKEALNITAYNFTTARLWKIEENSPTLQFIYALETTYHEEISKIYVGNNLRATVCRNNDPTHPKTLCAVKKENNIFKYSIYTYNYNRYAQREDQHTGKWNEIEGQKEFVSLHNDHLLKFHLKELSESSTIKKLQKKYNALKKEIGKGNTEVTEKANAINEFLHTIYSGEAESFMSIMSNAADKTYQKMITPCQNSYTIGWGWLTIDFTAASPTKTSTYGILFNIKYEDSFVNFKHEYDRQHGFHYKELELA